jgi:hypothetical protein
VNVSLLRAGRYWISTRHLILVEDGDIPVEPNPDPDPDLVNHPEAVLKTVPAGAIRFMVTWGRLIVVSGETAKAFRRQLEAYFVKHAPPPPGPCVSGTIISSTEPPTTNPEPPTSPPQSPPPKPQQADDEDLGNGWRPQPIPEL